MKYWIIILFLSTSSLCWGRVEKRIILENNTQTPFTARLSFPDGIQRPLPVIILLGGLKTGDRSIDLLHTNTKIIYATLEYPYQASPHKNLINKLREIPKMKAAIHSVDKGIDLLVAHLYNQKYVDKNKIIIAGASLGSPFAITAAVRNSNISGLMVIHGLGKGELVIRQQLLLEWGERFLSKIAATLMGSLLWKYLDYPAPEIEITKLFNHQRVLLIQADDDKYIPKEAKDAIRVALESTAVKHTILTTSGGHVRSNKKELLEKLIELSEQWLKQESLL